MALEDGQVQFKAKPKASIKIDTNPLQVSANYVEPTQIMMVNVAESSNMKDAIEMAMKEFEKEIIIKILKIVKSKIINLRQSQRLQTRGPTNTTRDE